MLTKIDKAIYAFAAAAGGTFVSLQANHVDTTASAVAAIVVGIIAGVGTFAVPNKPS